MTHIILTVIICYRPQNKPYSAIVILFSQKLSNVAKDLSSSTVCGLLSISKFLIKMIALAFAFLAVANAQAPDIF